MRPLRCSLLLLLAIPLAGVRPALAGTGYRILAPSDLPAMSGNFEPGDVVAFPDQTWENQTITLRGKGTREKPLTFRATNPGKFVLTGKSSIVIDGEWLVVEGITLKNAGIENEAGIVIRGSDNRLTACVVDGTTHKFGVRLFGVRHRVDHCYFANKTSGDPTFQIEVDAAHPNYHQIELNHFGPRAPLGRNGGETMRVGYSGQSMSNSRTTVERNLFDRCDGEIEIISSKSCENVYRGNTFRACDGMLTLRHGDRNVIDGNFFFGERKPNSGGVRIIGEDHVVTNNYIEGVMKGAFWITSGVPNSALNQYYQAKRAVVAFNTVVDSAGPYLDVAAGLGGAGRTLRPEAITIANNLFVVGPRGKFSVGEEGTDWKWLGNVVDGEGASSVTHAGVRRVELKFARGANGLLRLPAPLAAEGDFAKITTDIDGQPRTGRLEAGCDQSSFAPITSRPLTATDVGPSWLPAEKR